MPLKSGPKFRRIAYSCISLLLMACNLAWSGEPIYELLNTRNDVEVNRTFLRALENTSSRQALADRLLKDAAQRPELGLRLFNALCEYARNEAVDPKKRKETLDALGLRIKAHSPQTIRLIALKPIETEWANNQPLEIDLVRPEWRTMLGALKPDAFWDLVQKQRVIDLTIEARAYEYSQRHPRIIFTLRKDKFETTFIGVGPEYTTMLKPEELHTLFRLATAATYNAPIPPSELATRGRRYMKEVPIVPAFYTLAIFNPDHPQAEAQFLNALSAPRPAGESLWRLGLDALVTKKNFSPRAIEALLEIAQGQDYDQEQALMAIKRLGRLPKPSLAVQRALLAIYKSHSNEERRAAARSQLSTIAWETSRTLHDEIIQGLVEKIFAPEEKLHLDIVTLEGLRPFPATLADQLAERLEREPNHPARRAVEHLLKRVSDRARCEAELLAN